MRAFVLTDIEGVAGVDSFDRTRTTDEALKGPAMDQLAREVQACVEGIRSVHPNARCTVWDGHGSGGLREEDVAAVEGARYVSAGQPYWDLDGYDAVYFVGQHAMAGTAFAPLAHTYSSRHVAYYRLNRFFVGEFGARALVAGQQGVPTVCLAGDDKAAREAENVVPDIETAVVKEGTGLESADHLASDAACERVREVAARATRRVDDVAPFDRIEPPYSLEIRYVDPHDDEDLPDRIDRSLVTRIDARTVRIESGDLADMPF
ncbi:M55 family metallopeptidase [Halomarina oriensis]|uniref:Peptidase M55 n=1 Tax=Halomarina oriensis TaxID=671145 RepID=A0A6B0GQA5_9EURY|nr:M55 family metallopeptidase [Halomarina oriensis]MWG33838.1 peptidase M55 [Halomarina oriensis]